MLLHLCYLKSDSNQRCENFMAILILFSDHGLERFDHHLLLHRLRPRCVLRHPHPRNRLQEIEWFGNDFSNNTVGPRYLRSFNLQIQLSELNIFLERIPQFTAILGLFICKFATFVSYFLAHRILQSPPVLLFEPIVILVSSFWHGFGIKDDNLPWTLPPKKDLFIVIDYSEIT